HQMSPCVPKRMRVQSPRELGLDAASFDHLRDAAIRHTPFRAEPQPWTLCVRLLLAGAQVAVERPNRLATEADQAAPATLAEHAGVATFEIDVGHAKTRDFVEAAACVEKQPDHRRVAPIAKVTSLTAAHKAQ